MRKNYDIRLAALREYLKSLSADETTFIVEGGAEYHTKEDPFNYLMQHGAVTHDGRRIVLYNDLGDCTFAQVVRIRDKKARGKTLEKDEREWYRRNSDLVNIKNKLSQEEETTISTWLKLGKE